MEKGCIENAPLPEYIVHVLNCCRVTRFNLFCSFLEIILWLHMILEVNISRAIVAKGLQCMCVTNFDMIGFT